MAVCASFPARHTAYQAHIDQYEAVDRASNVFHARIPPELIDESKSVNLELAVGECSFHDAWTIHGSNPTSPKAALRLHDALYARPRRPEARRLNSNHKIYLLRGQDRTGGKNDYAPVPEF